MGFTSKEVTELMVCCFMRDTATIFNLLKYHKYTRDEIRSVFADACITCNIPAIKLLIRAGADNFEEGLKSAVRSFRSEEKNKTIAFLLSLGANNYADLRFGNCSKFEQQISKL
jgi:hypothetical protein